MGSIYRSALFLGADAMIANKEHMCPLSPAVAKVSSGAVEFIPSFHVKFLQKFFESALEQNFKIVSTDLGIEEDLEGEKKDSKT